MRLTNSSLVPKFLHCVLLAGTCWSASWASRATAAEPKKKMPSLSRVEGIVKAHFASLADHQEADLIAKGDVEPIFRGLEKQGWKVSDQDEILKSMLDDGHVVVQALRTPSGKRFMRKVSREANIYDRLDRVSQHPGGPALIQRVIQLPDGDKYAKANPGTGNPNLSDLLLIYERGSAHTRKLKDYDKPTGSIYTAGDFLKRLTQSYQKDAH
jgi:hypothetical protein